MRESAYRDCFLGILLPGEYQESFRDLVARLDQAAPGVHGVNTDEPSIVLQQLGYQNSEMLARVANSRIRPLVNRMRGYEIRVNGEIQSVFTGLPPAVEAEQELFLSVGLPIVVGLLYRSMVEALQKYLRIDADNDFNLRLPLARIDEQSAIESFDKKKMRIHWNPDQKWTFPINEVVICGKSSVKYPSSFERLITI